jgi:chemotaxis signal transduction protein
MNESSDFNEQEEQILTNRAEEIAREKMQLLDISTASILAFKVGKDQKYAIEYGAIEKVILDQKITPIPGVTPLLSGLIYHNSEIWPVVNLKILLNCESSDEEHNFILLRNKAYRYAFAVGAIIGQMKFDATADIVTLPTTQDLQETYIQGIYQENIALINISSILKLLESVRITSNKLVRNENAAI